MRREWKVVTAATTTPVSLQEAKDHVYVTTDNYNEDVKRKLAEAVDYVQRRVPGHVQLSQATYDLVLDEFPDGGDDDRITLTPGPVKSVSWIKYYNSSGTLTLYGSSNGSTASSTSYYFVAPTDDPGYVVPAFGVTWPATRDRPDAVTVRYVAGYASQSAVPSAYKAAIKLKFEELWDASRVDAAKTKDAIDSLVGGFYGSY